jgi:hypothetical protein
MERSFESVQFSVGWNPVQDLRTFERLSRLRPFLPVPKSPRRWFHSKVVFGSSAKSRTRFAAREWTKPDFRW